jgi:hypothetical protein
MLAFLGTTQRAHRCRSTSQTICATRGGGSFSCKSLHWSGRYCRAIYTTRWLNISGGRSSRQPQAGVCTRTPHCTRFEDYKRLIVYFVVPHRKRGGGETEAGGGEDGDHDDYVDEGNQHAAATGPPEAAESGAPPRSPNWLLLFGVAERIADPSERERLLAIARKLTGAETRAAAEIMSVLCCWDWWCSWT